EYYGYPKDFTEQLQKGFAAVTEADVQRVLRDRLDPGRLTIVAAGTVLEFQGLERLGRPVTSIDLAIAQPKLEVAKTDENSLERGKQILARAQEAVGGVEKLAAIKDTVQIADFKLSAAAGGAQVTETDR